MSPLETVDWFLNTGRIYQENEPARLDALLALLERHLEVCQSDEERVQLERRKTSLHKIRESQF